MHVTLQRIKNLDHLTGLYRLTRKVTNLKAINLRLKKVGEKVNSNQEFLKILILGEVILIQIALRFLNKTDNPIFSRAQALLMMSKSIN
jgi:hypothetical protein